MDRFTSLPLGAMVSKLVQVSGLPVQLQASYECNFYDDGVGSRDTFGLVAKVRLPKGSSN